MPQQVINIGVVPNDGLGDPARVAGTKLNEMLAEIYAALDVKVDTSVVDALDDRVATLENQGSNVDGGTY